MIAIKAKDTVYFASAAGHNNSYCNMQMDVSSEEDMHLWHLNDGKGTIVMLGVESDRIADLLRYSDVFNCELTVEALRELHKKIIDLYEGTNCRPVEGNAGVTIFIARGDRAFRVYGIGLVSEIEELDSIEFCKDRFQIGYELSRGIEDPIERIRAIYDLTEAYGNRRAYPISVINTRDNSYTLLTKDAR